jgi:hypothetical protein
MITPRIPGFSVEKSSLRTNTAFRCTKRTTIAARGSKGGDIGKLRGTFLRDTAASEMQAYEKMLVLLRLGRLQRLTAAQLIEGIMLRQDGGNGNDVALSWLTVVPFFQITEVYRLGGVTTLPRRDLQPGGQRGKATVCDDGSLLLSSEWNPPNAGRLEEQLRLIEDTRGDILEATSHLSVEEGSEKCTVRYRRVESWKPRIKWNPIEAARIMAGGSLRS